MPKFFTRSGGLLAFVAAFFAVKFAIQYVRGETAGLSGATRSAFVENAIRTCNAKQRSDASNKGIPDAILTEYCRCYANGMADRISLNELRKLKGVPRTDMIKSMKPVINASSASCIEAASKRLQGTGQASTSLPHSN